MHAPAALGRILTFYSYKGGTGRSMAVANVAWMLASSGRRVLVVDWDLEAPGLHRYFRPFLIDEELSASEGLIDLVDNYANEAIRPLDPGAPPPPDWYVAYADFTDFVVSVNFDHFPAGGKIDFLPAGRQGDRYALTVNSFNWQNFYDRLGGGGFFEAVKARAKQHYDYVLIDSRTGVSDTAGICSVQMPDSLVVCFTYNNQSIKGAAAVAQSAVRMRKKLVEEALARRSASPVEHSSTTIEDTPRPFRIFPIPMRVDTGESDRLRVRQEFARACFADFVDHIPPGALSDYWTGVEIPQTPFYSYEEVLAAFRDDPHDPKTVLSAFVRLTGYVTDGDVGYYRSSLSPDERQRILDAFARTTLPVAQPQSVQAARPETEEERVVRTADQTLASLPDADKLRAFRIFGRVVRLGRDEEGGGYFPIRASIKHFTPDEVAVIGTLAGHGLLIVETDQRLSQRAPQSTQLRPSPGDQVVAIADQRLLRVWKPLRDWLDSEREFLLWRQQLRTYLGDWERGGRDRNALLAGNLLNDAERWWRQRGDEINAEETVYLEASREARAAAATSMEQAHAALRPAPADTAAAPDSTSSRAKSHEASRRAGLLPVWVMAAVLVLLAVGITGIFYVRFLADTTTPAPEGPATAYLLIERASISRRAGSLADAIASLTEALRLADDDRTLMRRIHQDRAYCYKLGGEWERSIADLTSALAIDESLDDAARPVLLGDRGWAYLQIRDLEMALADYQALSAIDAAGSTVFRDYLSSTLQPRGRSTPAVFLFTEVGPLDRNSPAAVVTGPIQAMGQFTEFMNLRFWWYPIDTAEIRYTDREDARLATAAADTLRSRGLAVGPPVLLNSLVPRRRRIEVWYPRPDTARPASSRAPSSR